MDASVRFPLQAVQVRGGDTVRAFLPLELRRRKARPDEPDRFTLRREFRVDTAADVTVMSLAEARALDLPVPDQPIDLPITSAAGVVTIRLRVGMIVARVPGVPGELFFWPCHFHESVTTSGGPLLGMAGVVNGPKRLRLTIDGRPIGGDLLVELVRGAAL